MTNNNPLTLIVPDAEMIANCTVGTLAPDCFGKIMPVLEVFARDNDINGNPYVCYYLQFGENSRISGSMKAGELVHTVPLCNRFTSAELDRLEAKMVADGVTHLTI